MDICLTPPVLDLTQGEAEDIHFLSAQRIHSPEDMGAKVTDPLTRGQGEQENSIRAPRPLLHRVPRCGSGYNPKFR